MLRTVCKSYNLLQSSCRSYAKKVGGPGKGAKGVAAVTKKKVLDVETDANILVNYCCINYKIGEEPIKLKPDNEYPDWLWKLPIKPIVPKFSEVDTDSYNYWRRVRKYNRRKLNRLASLEGWFKKDHTITNHVSRFYGDWYYEMVKWENDKKQQSTDHHSQPYIDAEVKQITR